MNDSNFVAHLLEIKRREWLTVIHDLIDWCVTAFALFSYVRAHVYPFDKSVVGPMHKHHR